jgi:glycosyltransferase involved in cell wall biosynthesis
VVHVAQISFFNDSQDRLPEELLSIWPSLVDIAECASRGGSRVSVVQASRHSYRSQRNGVDYYFLPFGRATPASPMSDDFLELLRELTPDVAHVQGLGFPRDVLSLAGVASAMPIVLQDHADRVPRWWRRAQWRRAFAATAGIAFCSLAQAAPFEAARLLSPKTRIYGIPESTSRFMPGDVAAARRELQVEGHPLLVWVGHLDANKDPLTVLEGISQAARALPDLRLWCCFGNAPLLEQVQRRIQADPRLRERARLLGRLPHSKVERLMQSADVFVLGSHREGSGYSLIEALACGVTPVVTDIPSFRSLTGQGAVGQLWPVGDAAGLSRGILSAVSGLKPESRREIRGHFDRELSFEAVGMRLAGMYEDAIQHGRERDPLTRPDAARPLTS